MAKCHVDPVKTVTYSARADQQLAAMSPENSRRIEARIEQYAIDGGGDVKALRGVVFHGQVALRLRVGPWRVIFTEDMHIVDVEDIGNRASIYR